MAINIKEILHPSDSDSIKFEKINYNFDQILTNGGGPTGPQGQKGDLGQQGATGTKGQKGEIGDQGAKGETGVSDTPWAAIEHSNGVSAILKPKKSLDIDGDGTATSYSHMPAIWLGDSTFEEGQTEGENATTARITVALSDGVFDEYIKLWHDGTHKLNVSSISDDGDGYTEFRLQKELGNGDTSLRLNLDKITIKSDNDALLLQGSAITIQPIGNTNVKIESLGTGNLTVDLPSVFLDHADFNNTDYIKLPVGADGDRPAVGADGMIRFNSDSNMFEGFSGTSWKPIGGLTDTDQDTYITAEETADEDILKFYVGGTQSDLVASMGDSATDGVNSLTKVSNFVKPIVLDDNLYVDGLSKGITFKARTSISGGQPANYNSAASQRTIHDYFYRTSIAMEGTVDTISVSNCFTNHYPEGASNTTTIDLTTDKLSDDLFYIHTTYTSNSGGTLEVSKAPIGVVINTSASRFSYVKVGHQVTAWGKLKFWPFPVNYAELPTEGGTIYNFQGRVHTTGTTVTKAKTARVMIFPADTYRWPYRNSTTEKVIFPIMINMDSTVGATSPNDYVTSSDYEYYGVIFPGVAGFNIVRCAPGSMHLWASESTSLTTFQPTGSEADPYFKFLTLQDFEAAFITAKEVTLEYNFTMATGDNSYDAVDANNSRFMYNVGTNQTIVQQGNTGLNDGLNDG
jgi:hypothetical protein